MQVRPRALVKGLLSIAAPSLGHISHPPRPPAYYYSAWLRHYVRLTEAGAPPTLGAVAELGPGRAVGMGLAALLAGADSYVALDVAPYADLSENLEALHDLAARFTARAAIPGPDEFPRLKPLLTDHGFPAGLDSAPTAERIAELESCLRRPNGRLRYIAPWQGQTTAETGSLDWIFSQAVLEHVDDLAGAYAEMFRWLKPGGVMSHQIDFKSHGLTRTWNGHWALSPLVWRLLRGRRPYLINRQPLSVHLTLLAQAGFEVLAVEATPASSAGAPTLPRAALQRPFADLPDADLETSSTFIAAKKPENTVPTD